MKKPDFTEIEARLLASLNIPEHRFMRIVRQRRTRSQSHQRKVNRERYQRKVIMYGIMYGANRKENLQALITSHRRTP